VGRWRGRARERDVDIDELDVADLRVGFIGLGNVGVKLAGWLIGNGIDLTVRDLDRSAAEPLLNAGASWADSSAELAAGCDRDTFERVLPLLTTLGRRILHTGPLGSASVLKVMTHMLATANLVALTEALAIMSAAGLDLATTYEAIKISSGNSFVHETESQRILNGSRNVSFTMDLVLKDIGVPPPSHTHQSFTRCETFTEQLTRSAGTRF
jgi:3-hydroxyisobutyrate dehydrogenase-like beta-hydroxyacid dehydrogenase